MPIPEVNVKKPIDTKNCSKTEQSKVHNSSELIEVFGLNGNTERCILDKEVEASLFSLNQPKYTNATPRVDMVILDSELVQKYSAEELQLFSKFNLNQIQLVKELSKTQLCAKNIALIMMNCKEKDVKKIVSKSLEMEKTCGENNLKNIYFLPDSYDTSAYNLVAIQKDGIMRNELLDKDINRQAIEKSQVYSTPEGTEYLEREAHDFRTNTISKTRYAFDSANKSSYVTHEIRSKMDENGKMVSREYIKPSDIKGVYDIDVLHQDGILEPVSKTNFNERTGDMKVRKTMTSLDGTKTFYSYSDTPEGDRKLKYKIIDKDGNVLMNNKKSLKIISDNHYISTKNDKSYDITFDENSLTVKEIDNPENTATFTFGDIQGKKERFIPILKQMSGEELIALNESTTTLEGVENSLRSYYDPKDKSIHSGDDLFVVLHELGHAKDYKKVDLTNFLTIVQTIDTLISNDEELNETYLAEKKAFNDEFPNAQREHIDYFISAHHYAGPMGGLTETIAETNALSETPKAVELLGMRAQYLQQYFPKTIARLSHFL